jgi:hypothetical protein
MTWAETIQSFGIYPIIVREVVLALIYFGVIKN